MTQSGHHGLARGGNEFEDLASLEPKIELFSFLRWYAGRPATYPTIANLRIFDAGLRGA
jgi:hypothetical protein